MPELQGVRIIAEPEENPDLSHLGEYEDLPGLSSRTVDRKERGDMGDGERRYFIAAQGPDETGNPDSVEEDYQRAEAFNRGEWSPLVIRAEANVKVAGAFQRITSGGLHGVASDAGTEHLEEVAREELAELRRILGRLGVHDPEEPLKATWARGAPFYTGSGVIAEESPEGRAEGGLEPIYQTLYPPTAETVTVSEGEGFLMLEVHDQDGDRKAWRTLGRAELVAITKEGP